MATFTNQATLTYNDTTTSSNIVTGEILEVLSATKTAVVDRYAPNGNVTYVISIVNSGNTAFNGLTLTDDLGGNSSGGYPLAYDDGSVLYYINGALQAAPAVTAGPPLVIGGISVPANGNATIIYEADVTEFAAPNVEGTIVNNVAISGGGLTAPVTATETVNAEIGPDLAITKSISPATITENGQLTYTLTVVNTGNAAATADDDLVIRDTFDPILSDIVVTLDGEVLTEGTDYTYDAATGAFATTEGRVTVDAATFTQNPVGTWTSVPGISILTITGTV